MTGIVRAVLGAVLLGAAFFPAWGFSPAEAAPLKVLSGIPPVAFFAGQVGGNRVEVSSLLPPGADAHTWEPRPQQMASASKAALFLAVGLPFEKLIAPKLIELNRKLRVVRVDERIHRIEITDDPDGDTGPDPHVWVSLREAGKIVEAIRGALVNADPAGKGYYDRRARELKRKIAAMDENFRTLFAGRSGMTVLVYHPAWGYFCRDYGLIQKAVEVEGKEPKPAQMARLIDTAKKEKVRVIFIQPQMSPRAAETLAKEIRGRVVRLNPLDGDWLGQMEKTAQAFREALKR
jgi:zinc transport system substrate-binding protein